MNQERLKVAEALGTDLSSRVTAARVREEIAQKVKETNTSVYLDFEGVRTISNSFADELFAVLVEQFGRSWFRTWIHIDNLSDCIRRTILESVSSRTAGKAGT